MIAYWINWAFTMILCGATIYFYALIPPPLKRLKRLWCAVAHHRYWEVNNWNTAYCRRCDEVHDKN